MVDTYLQPEVHIVITQQPGVDGAGTTGQLAQIESDLATALARPAITELSDIPDVSGVPTNGQTIVFDSGDSMWKPGAITGRLGRIQNEANTLASDNIHTLIVQPGITLTPDTEFAYIGPNFGGTGSANAIARSDHTHTLRPDQPLPFAASGTLSSGTRTLVSGSVTGLDPSRTYLIKGKLYLHARGDGSGASFARPRVTIDGGAIDHFDNARLVAGVLITETTPHSGVLVTGVSSASVSASVSFSSGDPSYIGAGVLVIEITVNR